MEEQKQAKFGIGTLVRSVRRPERIGKVFDVEQRPEGYWYEVTWTNTHTTTGCPESSIEAWRST